MLIIFSRYSLLRNYLFLKKFIETCAVVIFSNISIESMRKKRYSMTIFEYFNDNLFFNMSIPSELVG